MSLTLRCDQCDKIIEANGTRDAVPYGWITIRILSTKDFCSVGCAFNYLLDYMNGEQLAFLSKQIAERTGGEHPVWHIGVEQGSVEGPLGV